MPSKRLAVFSTEDEKILVNHMKHTESNGVHLAIQEICQLAYEMTEDAKLPHSFNREKKRAGYAWSRHPTLSLRKPEGLSIARATMLNLTPITRGPSVIISIS